MPYIEGLNNLIDSIEKTQKESGLANDFIVDNTKIIIKKSFDLGYREALRDVANKIIELHCLMTGK